MAYLRRWSICCKLAKSRKSRQRHKQTRSARRI
jgi:hypothetical protein